MPILGVLRDLARQRAAEAGKMRAAVALRDVVGEAQHILVVAVVPLSAASTVMPSRSALITIGFGISVSCRGRYIARTLRRRRRSASPRFSAAALVGKHDLDAGIEEGQLAQAVLERREVEFDLGEVLGDGKNVTSVPRLPPLCRRLSAAPPPRRREP